MSRINDIVFVFKGGYRFSRILPVEDEFNLQSYNENRKKYNENKRLDDRDLVFDSERLDRCKRHLLAAPAGAIRLRDNPGDRMRRVEEVLERGHRKARRPEEHDIHRPAVTICRRGRAS